MTAPADDIEGADAFGTASLDREYDGPKTFKLKVPDSKKNEETTEFICRLLPPMKSLKDQQHAWKKFYGIHYGHSGNNPRDAQKNRPRPFACIEEKDYRTKEIKVHCPKCDQMEVMRSKQKTRESELKLANPSVAENEKAMKDICRADATYASYNEWLKKHNCDKKWYINVMSYAGEFGVLHLTYTTMKDVLEPKLKEWRDKEKLDVFHPHKGVWLRFTRSGVAPRVTDNVELFMDSVEISPGRIVKEVKNAPLTKEQIQRALKICPDLAKDVVKFLPPDKIVALIATKGDLDKVDEIWDGPKKDKATTSSSLESGLNTDPDLDAGVDDVGTTLETTGSVADTSTTSGPVEIDDEVAALEAQMKALKERKAQTAVVAKVAATEVAVTTRSSATESAEDFLSSFSAK